MKQMRAPLALFCRALAISAAQGFALAISAAQGFALAAPAFAQTPSPSPSDPPRRQETVNVEAELPALPPAANAATRLPVPVMELPLSVSVVPRSLMSAQEVFTLTDALRNASGVNTATGNGVFDFFTVRGVDSLTGGLVLTDGVPEPESTYYPLYNVHQVEVLKGPGSFLYGGNPLAGAVQIVRKQPAATRFAEGAFSYGRFGTYECAVDGNAGSSDGKVGFRLNAVRQGSSNYRDLGDGALTAANPVLVWRPDDDTHVLASFEYLRSEQPPDSGLPFLGESGEELAPVPRTRSYQSPFDFSRQDVHRVRLEAERKLSSSITLRDRAYFTQLEWDSDGTLISGAFPFPPEGRLTVIRTLVQLDDRQRLLGNQLELAASFATGRVRHELLAGLEISRLTDRFDQGVALVAPIDLLDPVEIPGAQPIPLPQFAQAGDARALTIAPYLVDRMAFSGRWQAFVGARLDTLDYEDPLVATQRDDTQLSPLLGLVFSPTQDLALHVSAGSSFAPPSTQVVGPRDPETARQIEAGAKLQLLGGKAFVGATAYALKRQDIAIPDSSGVFRQEGDERVRGLELDLSSEPRKGFIVYASYAFTDAELTRFAEAVNTPQGIFVFDRSGNTAAFVPRHLANVWLSKQLGRFGVAAGLRAVGEQFVGEDNRFRIGSYATLDAAVSYTHAHGRLSLHARNLTGTEYATRGFGGVSAIPARPFELLARVDVRIGTR